MDKWGKFNQVPPESWSQEVPAQGAAPIWKLNAQWCEYYFEGAYKLVIRDGDPFAPWWSIAVFQRSNLLTKEITVWSRRATGQYYDFTLSLADQLAWAKDLVRRTSDGKQQFPAKFVQQPGQDIFQISSPDIDEEMSVNPYTLAISLGQSRQEKEQELLPWKRILLWYARVRKFDPQVFERVPAPVKNFLFSGGQTEAALEMQASKLTWQQLELWQKQELMPKELSWLGDVSRPQVLDSIRLLQRLANDPYRQAGQQQNPYYVARIPHILRCVVAEQLDLLDLKVFMTIGALREVWGYREREIYKLLERRPDLKQLSQTPAGQQALQQDPEYQMIQTHPLSLKQQEEELEAHQHRKGDQGPTAMEKLRASERAAQDLMNQMWAQGDQLQAMLAPMMGSMGFGSFQPPPVPQLPTNPYLLEDAPPAWKIYKPYMI